MNKLRIVNIVATAILNSELNLQNLNKRLKNSVFPSSGKRWLKLRLKPEGYYIAFYKKGKFLITGVRSIKQVEAVANRVLSILKEFDLEVELKDIDIHNIVASGDLNFRVDINLMSMSLKRAIFEPEIFPGLIYRMKSPNVIILIFASGKYVCVGAKSEDDVRLASQNLLEVIQDLDFLEQDFSIYI